MPYEPKEKRYNIFFGEREKKFFESLTFELVHNMAQQTIIYFALDHDLTKPNIYGETRGKQKVFRDPVEFYARVQVNEPQDAVGRFSLDRKITIDVWVSLNECLDLLGFAPRHGDFVQFGDYIYSIYKVSDVRYRYGQEDAKMEVGFSAHVVRGSTFDMENRVIKGGHSKVAPH